MHPLQTKATNCVHSQYACSASSASYLISFVSAYDDDAFPIFNDFIFWLATSYVVAVIVLCWSLLS